MRNFVAITFVVVEISSVSGQQSYFGERHHFPPGLRHEDMQTQFAFAKIRPSQEDEERAGVPAQEQKIKIANIELNAAIAAEKDGSIRLSRAAELISRQVISAEDYAAAVLILAKLRNDRVKAEQRLKNLLGPARR